MMSEPLLPPARSDAGRWPAVDWLRALALPIADGAPGASTRHALGSLADVPAAFASGVLLCELADRLRGDRGTRVRVANADTPAARYLNFDAALTRLGIEARQAPDTCSRGIMIAIRRPGTARLTSRLREYATLGKRAVGARDTRGHLIAIIVLGARLAHL